MTEQDKKNATAEMHDDNPFCHNGMTCQKGCSCADENGICQCAMISDRRCTCNGLCGTKMAHK